LTHARKSLMLIKRKQKQKKSKHASLTLTLTHNKGGIRVLDVDLLLVDII
jgi:hypothetical protein